jgi:2'-5' RNA ligase
MENNIHKKRRVFVAIKLPQSVKEYIAENQKEINIEAYKLTNPKNLHITLLFLGYLSNKEIKSVKTTLETVRTKFSKFTLRLNSLLQLPSKENPRIISISIKSDKKLENLQNLLQNILSESNIIKPVNRDFKPHITIARRKEGSNTKPLYNTVEIKKSISWQVENFYLMESLLEPKGAQYITLYKFNLSKQE